MALKYRRGVFLVVYSKNKRGNMEYLILKRKLHWIGWEFPKGGLEKGEDIEEAALREVKEETGLIPLSMKRFGISGSFEYERDLDDREGFRGQKFEELYAINVEKKKVKIDDIEHSDYRWVNFEEAHKKLKWKNQKDCLKIVNDWVKKMDKFRNVLTKSNKLVLLGKNEKQNEELVSYFRGKDNIILHTEKPGSPFCIIDDLNPSKKDIEEAAVICARYSQNWRDSKSDVVVHKFDGKNIYKEGRMKIGTFGVKNAQKIRVKRSEIEKI